MKAPPFCATELKEFGIAGEEIFPNRKIGFRRAGVSKSEIPSLFPVLGKNDENG